MKIAYLSPTPPQHTGVADYSRELLPELVKRAEVDLWVEGAAATEWLPDCKIRNYVDSTVARKELRGYDAVIYHMGNSPAHRNIYRMLLAVPGVVVMHDFVLHHFFAAYHLEVQRSPAAYIDEMAYNYGDAGAAIARDALRGERQIWEHDPLRYPLNYRVLDHVRGVIVHSEFARRLIAHSHPHLLSAKVNLAVTIADPPPDQAQLRRRYDIPLDRIVIGSLGFGSAAKRLSMVLNAIRALGRDDVMYVVVGAMGEPLRRELDRNGLNNTVRATGYVDWETFNDYCSLIDIGVDLRYPTMGESSASVCRILGAGKPCLVSRVGWFAELPDDCCVKLAPASDDQVLIESLSALIEDKSLRLQLGANARKYIREEHNTAQAAAAYVAFVEQVRLLERRSRVQHTIIEATGTAMAEIGVSPDDSGLIDSVAKPLASLFSSD
jgi:glycosyltransferase involved in cell wall biosynthesis